LTPNRRDGTLAAHARRRCATTSTRAVLAAGIGIVAIVVAVVVLRWSPAVPADAASSPLTRTALSGPIAPDADEGTDISLIPRSPAGHECLPRIERSHGYIDACWDAYRHPADSDPEKDYYLLEVFATFGPGSGGSPRWAVLRADLDGAPADNVLTTWPDGEFDGTCQSVPVTLELVNPGTEATLCGHIAPAETSAWGRSVSWTCTGCLLHDGRDRALNLYIAVGVPAGTVPSWDIFADVGG